MGLRLDRYPVQKSLLIIQLLHPVAEQFTGKPGQYVSLSDTIQGFKEILEGKHDEIPEGMFLNAGTIEEVVERFAARNK